MSGYRTISALLKAAGWLVNDKRVERIWRREGLKVPAREPERGRIWDGDGSCLRLRAEHRDHVWSYDFVEARTHEERKFRMLNVVEEFSRECLAIRVARADGGLPGFASGRIRPLATGCLRLSPSPIWPLG